MEPPPSFDPALLAAHVGFARRLARGLVQSSHGSHGAHDAEDVAAEALAAAVVQRPETGASFRGWLRRVVGRLARRRAVADARRGLREQLAAGAERVARGDHELAADEVAAQIELERQLAVAFAALEEPTRSTLFRRYWLDLTPTQIAAETATPLATVKSRLQRGLEQLRARLDAAHRGKREEWLAALAPWISIGGPTVVATKSKLGLAAAATLLLAGAMTYVIQSNRSSGPELASISTPSPAVANAAATETGDAGRAPATEAGTVREPLAPSPDALPFASGRVVDASGAPLADVVVVASRLRREPFGGRNEQEPLRLHRLERDTLARTGADGRFAVVEPGIDLVALVFVRAGFGAAEWSELAADRAANQRHEVVLVPGCSLSGHVRDSEGMPVSEAMLWLTRESPPSDHVPERVARHLPDAPTYLDLSKDGWSQQNGSTDGQGAFAFVSIPSRPYRLHVLGYGYAWTQFDDAALAASAEFVIKRSALLVDVTDADDGHPLRAALVAIDAATGRVLQQVVPRVPADPDHSVIAPAGQLALDVGFGQPYRGVPPWLQEAKPSGIDVRLHVVADGYVGDVLAVTLSPEEEPPHLHVALTPDDGSESEPALAGRVTGAPHATVSAYTLIPDWSTTYLEHGPPLLSAACQDGAFAFRDLPAGRYRLAARAAGFADAWLDVDAPAQDVLIAMTPSASLAVRVRDHAGAPAIGVVVHAQPEDRKRAWYAKTNGDGVAVIDGLPAGKLVVGAFPDLRYDLVDTSIVFPLERDAFIDPAPVEARAGERTSLERTLLERVPTRLHFERDDGSPVTSVKFELQNFRGPVVSAFRELDQLRAWKPVLGANGDVEVALYPGHYEYRVSEATVARTVAFDVADGPSATATIRLPSLGPTGSIAGRVVDLVTGAPIARRKVFGSLVRQGAEPLELGQRLTDDEGRFAFADVPPGAVRVVVYAESRGDELRWFEPDPASPYGTASHRCAVESGQECAVEIALPPIKDANATFQTVELDARVTEAATGRPLERAVVSVDLALGATELSLVSSQTDADGRVRAKVYAGASYTITVHGPWPSEEGAAPKYELQRFELAPTDGVLTVEARLAPKR